MFKLHSLMVQLHMTPLEILHLFQHMAFSVGNQTSSLPSINTILSIGCSNWRFEFLFPDCSPMRSSTLQTNLFLLLLTPIILAIGQWFLETLTWYTITISLILKFLFLPSHFWHSCRDCRYSFFQQDKSSLAMSWICCQRFLQYIYQAWKTLLVVVKLPLISWLRCSQMARAADVLDHWELLQSQAWNSKCSGVT